jgi:hypothetical protein
MSAVSVTGPASPVVICNTTIESDHLDVAFTVRTSNKDYIRVPHNVITSDNRTCTAQGMVKHRE